jgi:hypothetical protein
MKTRPVEKIRGSLARPQGADKGAELQHEDRITFDYKRAKVRHWWLHEEEGDNAISVWYYWRGWSIANAIG